MGSVYGLIDGDTLELRYVGQTIQSLAARLSQHTHNCRTPNLHLSRWARAAYVSILVLERDPPDLNEAETRWIREMREQGARLLNFADGGSANRGQRGRTVSAETRARISTAMRGRFKSEETRAKFRIAMTGHAPWNKGKACSAETRAKMRAAQLGVPCPQRSTPYALRPRAKRLGV
jgi:hypothetical protein